jgi:hypothetical protein
MVVRVTRLFLHTIIYVVWDVTIALVFFIFLLLSNLLNTILLGGYKNASKLI